MHNSKLPEKLFQMDGFQEKFLPVVIQSVAKQFHSLKLATDMKTLDIDWNYMLLCASILAKSSSSYCLDAAFRVAQACLINEETGHEQKAAAVVVMDVLTNSPAIKLAVDRGYIKQDPLKELPFTLQLEKLRRGIQYSILSKDEEIYHINRFQTDVYHRYKETGWMSISAPTSSGKSFILLNILTDFFKEESKIKKIAIYIVPTRSLIQQVEFDISETFISQRIKDVFITSVPLLLKDENDSSLVFVLTQERFKWLLTAEPELKADLIIVDEAQKIGDGARGVLLQEVIEEVSRRSKLTQVIFSSPMTSNPEILLEQAPTNTEKHMVTSEHVAVNQNLIWVSQIPRKPKQWKMELCLGEKTILLGEFELPFRPDPESKRLSFVAHSLSDRSGGNLVYVNGPAEAEKMARQLWELQGEEEESEDSEILDLIKLSKKVINRHYVLAMTLKRGVGFHYGNMPLLVKNEIERLFKNGKIKFLICTSTLIEGVNLPAKSIFVRGPRKGTKNPMGEIDFWNLAGRAGRQGKEFQGNVICIDPMIEKVWNDPPPRIKTRYPIKPTLNNIVDKNGGELLTFIDEKAPRYEAAKHADIEHTFVYFVCEFLRNDTLRNNKSLQNCDNMFILELESKIKEIVNENEIPKQIIYQNSGVSPLALNDLLNYFRNYSEIENLIPPYPEDADALEGYIKMVGRISRYLSGDSLILNYPHALLILNWMSGKSLSFIINRNWKYWEGKNKTLPVVIRDTMRDIEEYARFKFVKYSSCYIDVLKHYFNTINRVDLVEQIPEMNIWLEFGASQQTQVSLMSLGLSRTSAIEISELIISDDLTVRECSNFLSLMDLHAADLSPIIKKEIQQVLLKQGLLSKQRL